MSESNIATAKSRPPANSTMCAGRRHRCCRRRVVYNSARYGAVPKRAARARAAGGRARKRSCASYKDPRREALRFVGQPWRAAAAARELISRDKALRTGFGIWEGWLPASICWQNTTKTRFRRRLVRGIRRRLAKPLDRVALGLVLEIGHQRVTEKQDTCPTQHGRNPCWRRTQGSRTSCRSPSSPLNTHRSADAPKSPPARTARTPPSLWSLASGDRRTQIAAC